MKNILYYTVVLLFSMVLLSSCEKDEIGGTATEAMAGEWYVTYDVNYYHWYNCYYTYNGYDEPFAGYSADADGDGDVDLDDLLSDAYAEAWWEYDGPILNTTSNTSSDSDTEMWLTDDFWGTQTKIDIDINEMTFSVDSEADVVYGCTVNILGGKIIYDAATTPSGSVADSIIFYINYNDDYGDDIWYKVSGYRYTGLTNDD